MIQQLFFSRAIALFPTASLFWFFLQLAYYGDPIIGWDARVQIFFIVMLEALSIIAAYDIIYFERSTSDTVFQGWWRYAKTLALPVAVVLYCGLILQAFMPILYFAASILAKYKIRGSGSFLRSTLHAGIIFVGALVFVNFAMPVILMPFSQASFSQHIRDWETAQWVYWGVAYWGFYLALGCFEMILEYKKSEGVSRIAETNT